MLKVSKLITIVLLISFIPVLFAGCGNSAQDSALIGAVIGTGIGALVGGDLASMAIGGSVGSGIGYWVGSEQEKHNAAVTKNQQFDSLNDMVESEMEGSEIVWITNSNGSKTPVKMVRSGNGYVGPRNDHYASLPSSQQLSPAYGF
jgi:hypothetical protein